eukprot:TRINITY_DN7406_c0_g1_i1.p1 TRINITY_DN7406_c0_g1~~TRINITY_DN7406_c0_g1_i1.p1  ORF type:complete len:352 (-),score=84.93 TRINITY_DN7406_c0_g1_i1:152-1207(-)
MAAEASAKRTRSRSRSPGKAALDHAALSSQSREGYFGARSANTDSNAAEPSVRAAGDERIVLGEQYGHRGGPDSPRRRALTEPDTVAVELQGCAGRYADKVVIITGGGRGIGEGCVRTFFEAGSNVVMCDRNAEASKLADTLNKRGAKNKVLFVRTDVSVVAELEALVDTAVKHFGRLDCIINNAGWHPPPLTIDDFAVSDAQDLMQLNFISTFSLCKFALPHIRKVKGNIINMSSLVGAFGQANAVTYAATKGAITAFSKALAIDEARHGVRVNTVSPGNVWTPLWKNGADAEKDPKAAMEAGMRVQVMGRMGTIFETGRLCLCIAADMTFTTGVDHILSGGAEIGYGIK